LEHEPYNTMKPYPGAIYHGFQKPYLNFDFSSIQNIKHLVAERTMKGLCIQYFQYNMNNCTSLFDLYQMALLDGVNLYIFFRGPIYH
jgi:hypothetical protein